jgi:LysR family hydrogen peroxide-inducible transcriptional activator
MPTRLTLFSRKYPQACVTVVEDITVRLLDQLRAGLIDMAVLALPARGHDLESFALRTERLYAILPRDHRLSKKRSLQLKELRGEPFLLLRDDHCFRETAIEVCKRARVHPQVIFESGQFSSIVGMVGAGLGISLMPEMALEQRPDCSFVLIADERASRTVGVATLKGRFLSRVQRAFLTHLRASAQGRNTH